MRYGMSKREVLERMGRRKSPIPQDKTQDESYISLTEIARAHSEDASGYAIQRWLRSENTLAFLKLWEKENKPEYRREVHFFSRRKKEYLVY